MEQPDDTLGDILVVSLSREEWSSCAQALATLQDESPQTSDVAERLQTIATNITQGLEQAPSDFSAQLPHGIWCDCAMALAFVLSQQQEGPDTQAHFVKTLRSASIKICEAILPTS